MEFEGVDTSSEEIQKRAHDCIIENERRNICQRGDKRKLTRAFHHHRVEHELYLEDLKTKSTYNNVQTNLEKEENLAKELQKEKIKEITDIKIRQQLRETSLELRELEKKLRAAYVTKELSAQLAEKEYLKLKKKMEAKEANEILQSALRSNTEAEKFEKQEEFNRQLEYRKELQDQMIMKYQKKQYQYEEFLKEKKLLDEIIQRIHDEDEREIEDKMCKMKKTKMEIDAFKQAQKIWREKEKNELDEENKRIEECLRNKEIQEREKAIQKMSEQAAKDQAMEELAKKMYIAQLEKKEREEILQDLMFEEVKELEQQKIKEKLKRQIQDRIEMQNVLNRQLEERQEKLRQEELADAQYKQQMYAKIMEDDRLEQLSTEKRRRKMMELRREVEEDIKERRAKRAEEMRTILYLQEQDKFEEDKKRKIIEDERLRLLKEHASNLIGYLPPGVLREDDLPHLGSEFVQYYSTKK